jgi:hypothetical protein
MKIDTETLKRRIAVPDDFMGGDGVHVLDKHNLNMLAHRHQLVWQNEAARRLA